MIGVEIDTSSILTAFPIKLWEPIYLSKAQIGCRHVAIGAAVELQDI